MFGIRMGRRRGGRSVPVNVMDLRPAMLPSLESGRSRRKGSGSFARTFLLFVLIAVLGLGIGALYGLLSTSWLEAETGQPQTVESSENGKQTSSLKLDYTLGTLPETATDE